MVRYLLDTNAVISFMKEDAPMVDSVIKAGMDSCFISELTMAELHVGPRRLMRKAKWNILSPDYKKAEAELESIREVEDIFEILPLSGCARIYAEEHERLRAEGTIIEDMDLLLGSFAVSHGFTLVTSNVRHFSRIEGLSIVDWKEGRPDQ